MGYKDLAVRLLSAKEDCRRACVGLDGFVDRILRIVDQRFDASHVTFVQTLKDYGQTIASAAGLSLNVEIVPELSKYGGNGPIMAGALASLGCGVSCIGAMGYPELAEEFFPLKQKAALYSFAQPAATDSYEFADGKIISSMLDSLNRLDWEQIVSRLGIQDITMLFDQADLIALNNWTMIPAMTQIWAHLQSEILPNLSARSRILFFDLADPSKRTKSDLQEMLAVLQGFAPFGRVVLSCNQREAMLLAAAAGIDADAVPLQALCRLLQRATGVYCMSIHTLQAAYAATSDTFGEADGFYTPAPKLSVGGGDHFNAGFMFGLLHGSSLSEALITGSAVSGYYVRTGRSPSLEELAAFLSHKEEN